MLANDIVLKVRIVNQSTPLCRVPSHIVSLFPRLHHDERRSGQRTQSVAQLTLVGDKTVVFYALHVGDLHDSADRDCIEIASSCLSVVASRSTATTTTSTISPGDAVYIHLFRSIPVAQRVYVAPQTDFDWDIVQTYANRIEDSFLRSHCILPLDQSLQVAVSPSLKASLVIKGVDFNRELLLTARRSGLQIDLVALGDGTELAIDPKPIANEERLSSCTTQPSSLVTQHKKEVSIKALQSVDIGHVSATLPLRLLPSQWQTSSTNAFASSRGSHHASDLRSSVHQQHQHQHQHQHHQLHDLLDAALNAFDVDDDTAAVAPSAVATPSNANANASASVNGWDTHAPLQPQSAVVYVHPIVIQHALERVLGVQPLSKAAVRTYMSLHDASHWVVAIGAAETMRHSHHSSSTFDPLQRQYYRLGISEHVRPFGVVVPALAQATLQLRDYDDVRLRIFTSVRSMRPLSITLQPIHVPATAGYGTTTTFDGRRMMHALREEEVLRYLRESCPAPATTSATTATTTTTNPVVAALIAKLDETHHDDARPLLLFDTSIVTLSVRVPSNGAVAVAVAPTSSAQETTAVEGSGGSLSRQYTYETMHFLARIDFGDAAAASASASASASSSASAAGSSSLPCVALNLWDAEEESVFQLLNSMHVQASSTVDLPWAWRRSPANTDDESSSGAAATSTATTMAAAVETASLVGFEPVYKSLLLLLSGHFAVRSVVHRCHYRCPLPPTVIALDGAAGTGKSTVVQSLCAAAGGGLLTRNGRLALHVERLDGKRLCSGADLPLEQALQRLTEAYARAATYAPSLVVVEDAHVLCQPFADDAATRDERRLLLMLHLQRLLGEAKAQNRRQHEKAQALAAEYHQNAAVSSSSSSSTAADECFWREEVAAVALAGRVVTLLVTESLTETCDSSLWPHANGASVAAAAAAAVVDRVVPMPYLHGDQRWKIWQRLSRRVTATETETATATEAETVREHRQHRKWFIRQSEGYVVRDLVKVAELFTAQQLQQRHATSPMSKTELWSRFTAATTAASTAATAGRSAASSSSAAAASRRWDDLVAVMQTYVPLATSSASSSSSSAAASQQSPSQQVQPLDTLQRRHRLMDRIGGYHDVKHVLQRTLRFPLTYHRLYARSPIKLPRALMLFGPPGIGKTFLAQALGQQFGQGFFSVRGPQLLDKYIGASEKAVRALFQRAQALKKPALLFFDEFEALAPRRGKDNTGVTDRIVNQLLTFIDGVEGTRHGDAGADNDDGDGDGDGDEEARAGDGTAASHRRRVMASAATVDGERDRDRENEDDEDEDDEDDEGTYTSPLRMKDYDAYDSDHRSPSSSSSSSSLPPAAHRDGAATRPAAASAAAAPCPIFILVASSRPDLIDPALLRPGRVEKHVYIGYPSSADVVDILRKQLLAVNAAAATADEDPAMQTVLQRIAQTEAVRLFTPADLKAIVDTAYLLAVHERLAAGDRPSTGGGGVGGPVTIAPPHLWRAFQETRPSTTASDRSFFESVYQRFLDQKQAAADATGPPPPTPPPSQPPLHESLTRKAAEAALPLQIQDIADDQRVSLR